MRGRAGVTGVPSPGHASKGAVQEPKRARAATLAAVPVGERPTGVNCPVGTVVISGSGEGDRTAVSPEVKVSVREASNSAGRSKGELVSPEIGYRLGGPSRWELSAKASACREGTGCTQRQSPRGRRGRHAGKERCSESAEPLVGRLGVVVWRTARTSRISHEGEIEVCRRVGRMGSIK
jgi:hypothetical protein